MTPLGTASVAALRQYVRAAEAAGIDAKPLLERCRIDPAVLASDEGRILGEQLQQFILLLIEQTDNPILGLQTGDFVQPGSYTVVGYITMSCATLGEAVTRIAPYERLVGDMGTTRLRLSGDKAILSWRCHYTDPQVRAHIVDNVISSWINYARWLADNETASPTLVRLTRRSPGKAFENAYRERWHCDAEFEADEDAIVFDKSLLEARLRQPDPLLRKTLEAHALTQLAALETDTALTARVKQMIQNQLMQGISRQDVVADALGMTNRTLQRRLSQENTSYQKLLDEVRQSLAEDYLRNSDLSIPDIALKLGYSETTSFHRKFKATNGKTPGEYRASSRQEVSE